MKLHTQLQIFRKDSLLMHEFLDKVEAILDHLTIVRSKVPKRKLIIHLLHGLEGDYIGFVTSLNMRSIEPTLQEIQNILIVEKQVILRHHRFDEN